ncbi:MAG TPA: M56 family metallopeptidase, partial [Planctomycetaceae bacterium]|nr:M56 family metallopeptidase [Planctomycetaceae bacterium]
MSGTLLPTWLSEIVDRGTAAGLHLFVQSALLIALGLLAAWLCRRRGAALQSAVLRVTLVGVLLCPLATLGLSAAGVQGFSLSWSADEEPAAGDSEAAVNHSAAEQPAQVELDGTQAWGAVPETVDAGESVAADRTHGFGDESVLLLDRGSAGPATQTDAVAEPVSTGSPAAPPIAVPQDVKAGRWPAAGLRLAVAALCGVWALGVAALVVRLFAAQILIGRLCRRAEPAGPEVLGLCAEVSRRLGVTPPPVLLSEQIHSPCLAGVWRPAVLLPCEEAASREVLTHELAHAARHDALFLLLSRLATAMLFYQPLV